ncbi:alpha/beta fold hydrolase [Haloplanus halobius]|uniref:alpha/beta fold hydrolase n=1 Tax=Haloplanus halobius TaxID=2934938 RepID=UPI00200E9575|nr:alpha/beta hydrolase [Haloplanus sp. XH21]
MASPLRERPDRRSTLSTETCPLSDGRTLAYTTGGDPDGVPVVAHHGTPGSRLFAALLSAAAADTGVRLLVPDRPGYGRSSSPPRDWTWWAWQHDLTELLRSESIRRAGVMGFSGGGPFAIAAADSDWASRLALVSTVVPPADTALVRLSRVPFAVRLLFRAAKVLAAIRSEPKAIVEQYTDRSVSAAVARAVADDFHEALRQGARAVARENRSFATDALEPRRLSLPVHAWHGTQDTNTPLSPVRAVMHDVDGRLSTTETDHLGTLLDCRRDVFEWLSAE